jgi:LysM repeat protein
VLLAVLAIALGLLFGAPGTLPSASQLPATWPGFSSDEGVFLVTSAENGSQAVFFIAQNQRHSITSSDLQQELQLNPLRPVRGAMRDEVLHFVEGAPVGSAPVGLLLQSVPAPAAEAPEAVADAPASTEDTTHVLQPGDNLTRVSARFGVDQATLMAANGITNANRVYVGQTLVIPGSESAPAVAETTSVAEEAPTAVTAETYVVQPGDSAFKIARKFGVDQGALLEANGISNPNRVYAGQTPVIPGDV